MTEPEYLTVDRRAFHREQADATVARFPRRYREATASHPQVLAWVQQMVAAPADAPSLLLAGRTGVGKTYEAYGALRAVKYGLADRGRPIAAAWTTHAELNAKLRPSPDGSHHHALDEYAAADLLLFDDVAAGLSSEWTQDSLYRLVDGRWLDMRPTIFTTNLAPDKLAASVGDRLMSRIHGMSTVVLLDGPDRRRAL